MKRWIAALITVCCLFSAASAAENLTGEWKGTAKVSGFLLAIPVTVQFQEGNTVSLSTFGLSAKGKYSLNGDTLTVSVSELHGLLSGMLLPPERIGEIEASISFTDSSLVLSADTHGIQANADLQRVKAR